jgi:hypothetical protein
MLTSLTAPDFTLLVLGIIACPRRGVGVGVLETGAATGITRRWQTANFALDKIALDERR